MSLWLYNVQLTNDNSSYYVSIINPYNSINSDPATLNVQARPVTVPLSGYAKTVVADGAIGFWQLNEPTGSSTAVDTVGSFDGTYVAGNGSLLSMCRRASRIILTVLLVLLAARR